MDYFPLIAKFTFSKLDTKKKNLYVENTQTLRVDNVCFFQIFFFSTKCTPFLLKIRVDFNIDDYRGKNTWTTENYFYNWLEHIWLTSAFDLENYRFWKCTFNKSYSCLCEKSHECIIYIIWNQIIVKINLYLKWNVKRGTWNKNYKLINQHKHDMCHV